MRRICSVTLTLCVVAVFLISGCAAPPQPTQSPLQQLRPATASPATTSPLPTPTLEPKPSALKVEKPGTATVGGRLLRVNNTPIKNATIYVAAIDESTGSKLASIDPAIDPRTETDANGYFRFSGLQPGEYGLVISTPTGLIMPETAENKSVVFSAKADQVTDAGSILILYEYPDS